MMSAALDLRNTMLKPVLIKISPPVRISECSLSITAAVLVAAKPGVASETAIKTAIKAGLKPALKRKRNCTEVPHEKLH